MRASATDLNELARAAGSYTQSVHVFESQAARIVKPSR